MRREPLGVVGQLVEQAVDRLARHTGLDVGQHADQQVGRAAHHSRRGLARLVNDLQLLLIVGQRGLRLVERQLTRLTRDSTNSLRTLRRLSIAWYMSGCV